LVAAFPGIDFRRVQGTTLGRRFWEMLFHFT